MPPWTEPPSPFKLSGGRCLPAGEFYCWSLPSLKPAQYQARTVAVTSLCPPPSFHVTANPCGITVPILPLDVLKREAMQRMRIRNSKPMLSVWEALNSAPLCSDCQAFADCPLPMEELAFILCSFSHPCQGSLLGIKFYSFHPSQYLPGPYRPSFLKFNLLSSPLGAREKKASVNLSMGEFSIGYY